MEALCTFLLHSPTDAIRPLSSAYEWLLAREALPFSTSIERAAAAGFLADRLGYAFAAGYQEALGRLLMGTPLESQSMPSMALCATEEGGVQPRAIQTTLGPRMADDADSALVLSGRKRFVTLGALARWLLVIARRGLDEQGRSQLAAVCIPSDRAGVTLHEAPATPFVPEIPHASVSFLQVEVAAAEVLPGDGYLRYLKPFRTIEDLHVHAAVLGYLIQIARRFAWPREQVADALSIVCALLPLAAAPPLSPVVHVALSGAITATARFVQDTVPQWAQVDAAVAARFQRDQRLLAVAGQARSARLTSAWQALSVSPQASAENDTKRREAETIPNR